MVTIRVFTNESNVSLSDRKWCIYKFICFYIAFLSFLFYFLSTFLLRSCRTNIFTWKEKTFVSLYIAFFQLFMLYLTSLFPLHCIRHQYLKHLHSIIRKWIKNCRTKERTLFYSRSIAFLKYFCLSRYFFIHSYLLKQKLTCHQYNVITIYDILLK